MGTFVVDFDFFLKALLKKLLCSFSFSAGTDFECRKLTVLWTEVVLFLSSIPVTDADRFNEPLVARASKLFLRFKLPGIIFFLFNVPRSESSIDIFPD